MFDEYEIYHREILQRHVLICFLNFILLLFIFFTILRIIGEYYQDCVCFFFTSLNDLINSCSRITGTDIRDSSIRLIHLQKTRTTCFCNRGNKNNECARARYNVQRYQVFYARIVVYLFNYHLATFDSRGKSI